MKIQRKLAAKEISLIICFTALYVVFGFLSISPIIGMPGKAITMAAILAPIMGIILGPYLGSLSTFFGGVIGFFFGSFSMLSFASGVFASLCAGMLYSDRRIICVGIYLSLLLVFGFFPFVGSVWIYPLVMWFQIATFLLLVSPLSSIAVKNINSNNNSKILYAFFVVSLISTLAGQIAGSLTFEILFPDANFLKATWIYTTFIYPVERVIIAVIAAFMGASVHKVLSATDIIPFNQKKRKNEV
jgi:predicted membrane protein